MSRHTTLWAAVLILGLLVSYQARGQDSAADDTVDLEGWVSLELKYKLNKQWMFSAEEQLRLKDDISEVDRYFSQLGVRFNAPHGISLDGGYRWIRKNDTQGNIQGYESKRRYQFSASYQHKIRRFTLGYRVRYQNQREVGSADSDADDRHLRFRTRIRYNIPNWQLDPVFAAELYRSVGGDGDSEFDKIRFTLGTSWGLGGEGEMGTFYRIERELGVESPQTTHIVGLSFSYTLGKN